MAVLKTIIGNVRGPKGDKGDQGIQGPVGPVGPKGDMPDITGKLDKGNLPSKIKSGKDIYDLIEKQTGAVFNPTLLFLNDAGTKEVGKLYFDKNKQGIFKCIKETTGTDNSTEFFLDVSPNSNSDRLSNLRIKPIETFRASTVNINSHTTSKIFTITKTGLYIVNICYQQSGADGNDTISMLVNGIDTITLLSSEMTNTHTLCTSCIIYLDKGDVISLKTNLSGIKMAEVGLSSNFILLKTF